MRIKLGDQIYLHQSTQKDINKTIKKIKIKLYQVFIHIYSYRTQKGNNTSKQEFFRPGSFSSLFVFQLTDHDTMKPIL